MEQPKGVLKCFTCSERCNPKEERRGYSVPDGWHAQEEGFGVTEIYCPECSKEWFKEHYGNAALKPMFNYRDYANRWLSNDFMEIVTRPAPEDN